MMLHERYACLNKFSNIFSKYSILYVYCGLGSFIAKPLSEWKKDSKFHIKLYIEELRMN